MRFSRRSYRVQHSQVPMIEKSKSDRDKKVNFAVFATDLSKAIAFI